MAKYIVEAQPCSIALREVEVKVVKVSQSGESVSRNIYWKLIMLKFVIVWKSEFAIISYNS